MVLVHDVGNVTIKARGLKDLEAQFHMGLHQLVLNGGQFGRFAHQVGGHSHFAHVVQPRGDRESVDVFIAHPKAPRDCDAERRDAPLMPRRVGVAHLNGAAHDCNDRAQLLLDSLETRGALVEERLELFVGTGKLLLGLLAGGEVVKARLDNVPAAHGDAGALRSRVPIGPVGAPEVELDRFPIFPSGQNRAASLSSRPKRLGVDEVGDCHPARISPGLDAEVLVGSAVRKERHRAVVHDDRVCRELEEIAEALFALFKRALDLPLVGEVEDDHVDDPPPAENQ